jgi:hypothetical protein
MTLEVITRTVYTISNREVITDLRQALTTDNIDHLDDLIAFLNDTAGADATSDVETSVLEVQELPAERRAKGVA